MIVNIKHRDFYLYRSFAAKADCSEGKGKLRHTQSEKRLFQAVQSNGKHLEGLHVIVLSSVTTKKKEKTQQ